MMRHRESWAEQNTAPAREAWEREQQAEQVRAESGSRSAGNTSRQSEAGVASSQDVLIVVSKLKQYIRQQSGMNTSDNVTGILSDHVRHLCDQAIANAAQEGRKTVMDRDFPPVVD